MKKKTKWCQVIPWDIMAQDVNVYEIFEYSIVWDVYVFTC